MLRRRRIARRRSEYYGGLDWEQIIGAITLSVLGAAWLYDYFIGL